MASSIAKIPVDGRYTLQHFLEMLAWHRKHGEDAVLMELCEELKSLELPK
jgi:hypothetical protein